MPETTHNDLHRDIGRMEGRLDAIEGAVAEIKADVQDIKKALETLTKRDAERGAFEKAGVWLAGVIGAAIAIIIGHFWK